MFCSYVEELRNSLVDAYFRTRNVWVMQLSDKRCIMTGIQPLVILRNETGQFIGINPQLCKLLSSGWTGPFIVAEKVSVVDYRIRLHPDGSSKVVHVNQLILDPCHQDSTNWIRDELAPKIMDDKGTDPALTVGTSIVCQTSDTDYIVVSNDKADPTIIVVGVSDKKASPVVSFIIYISRVIQSWRHRE